MRMVKTTREEFNKVVRPYTKLESFVWDFYNSDCDVIKVEDYTHKNAHSCANGLYMAIKRLHLDNSLRVRTKDNIHVYIERKEK